MITQDQQTKLILDFLACGGKIVGMNGKAYLAQRVQELRTAGRTDLIPPVLLEQTM